MNQDIISQIKERSIGFSKGQKAIARYLTEHYDKAAFMTASKLGLAVGVSESTVVRFACELGYSGYPQLQKGLRELIRNRLTSVQRIQVSNDQMGSEDILKKVLLADIEKIKYTLEEVSKKSFEDAVDAIMAAKNIYIIGVRSASVLAGFLSFYFNYMFENVKLVNTNGMSEIFEQILRIGKEDVFIAVTFPRYSKRTRDAAKYAAAKGARVIAITDSEKAPIAEHADSLILARSDMVSFVDSLVAPLSIINALIVAVGLRKSGEVSDTFEKLERIWEEYEVYEKDMNG